MSKPTDAARNAAQFLRDEIPDPLDVVLDFGTREMVIDLMRDHAAAELTAYREGLRAEVQAMPFRGVVSRDNGNLEFFINRADVLELIGEMK